jgi:hypothetical protein
MQEEFIGSSKIFCTPAITSIISGIVGYGKNDGLTPSTVRLKYEVDFSPLLSVRIIEMLKFPTVVIGEKFNSEVPVTVMKVSLG